MKLTPEELNELNELFECKKFTGNMTDLDLYTTVMSINSRRIRRGENNLRIIPVDKKQKGVEKIIGTFLDKKKSLMNISLLDKNGGKIGSFDFYCSDLYLSSGTLQEKDIDNGKVNFSRLIGDIFVPKSRYIGFKLLYI